MINTIKCAIFALMLCVSLAHAETIEVAFSPDSGAEASVLRAIGESKVSILLAAYSFTSPNITKALIEARKRGVIVRMIVDGHGNVGKANKAALRLLAASGADIRTTDRYAIHHDKYMVIDLSTVQTGSFNYSQAAAKSNSENVVIIRDSKPVADKYLQHWRSRFEGGDQYNSQN